MADMTNTTLEQRARELLAAECRRELWHSDAAEVMAGEGDQIYGPALRAIEAALRLPAGEGWQPIETAPLNLDDVLLWDEGDVMVGYYAHGRWQGRVGSLGDLLVVEPTHWQPLPAAPRHETGE